MEGDGVKPVTRMLRYEGRGRAGKPQERRTKTGRRNPTAERNAGPLDNSKTQGGLEELCTMRANWVT